MRAALFGLALLALEWVKQNLGPWLYKIRRGRDEAEHDGRESSRSVPPPSLPSHPETITWDGRSLCDASEAFDRLAASMGDDAA